MQIIRGYYFLQVKELKISFFKINEKKLTINLNKLEVLIDGKYYGITNYETNFLELDKKKNEVIGENLISIMNGKEYILKARELFVGKNLNFLLEEINKIKNNDLEKEKEVTKVKKIESKILLQELEEFNKKNYKSSIMNLIDIALDNGDINLFNSLTNKL